MFYYSTSDIALHRARTSMCHNGTKNTYHAWIDPNHYVQLGPSTLAHPWIVNWHGNASVQIMGQAVESGGATTTGGALTLWSWDSSRGEMKASEVLPGNTCTLAHPHSNAFTDLTGDCLPGIYLQNDKPYISLVNSS